MSLGNTDKPLIDAFDYLFLDLDGVCYRGTLPVENAAASLAQARAKVQRLQQSLARLA